jgi:hypothetical protein
VGGGPFFQYGGGWSWARQRAGKQVADSRVERSLYQRAVGYNYESVKIFMPANRSKPVYAKYTEHVPPDVTAGIFWLKNRDPQHWRDSQQMEHVLGKYIISDRPMSEEEWARERADVLDVEPRSGDGRQETHRAYLTGSNDTHSPPVGRQPVK